MVWHAHLFQNFQQFIVIHTVKGFGIVNKAEIDVFLELSCFFDDPGDVSNLISGSSAFSKTSLNICKLTVHVLLKPGLDNFKHYLGGTNWAELGKKRHSVLHTFAQVVSSWRIIICSQIYKKKDVALGTLKKTSQLWASLVAQLVKNQPAVWETWVQSLGWEGPLEKGTATHSRILVWRIPWTV